MGKLRELLDKLREQTNYCPYCSGEYVHHDGCILRGKWFDDERKRRRRKTTDHFTDQCPPDEDP